VRLLLSGLALVLLLVAGGCGGDSGDSGFTNDDVSTALGLRFDGPDMVYVLPSGQECTVINVLTESEEVISAQANAEAVDYAVATNPSGDAGVEFAGSTGVSPDECVGPAEANLKTLSAE
jgi:hypothetical protein